MQKLCCVRTRQHPLPVWSYNLSLTNQLISQPILIHFWWELYQVTPADVEAAEQMFRPDIGSLKGKTTRRNPPIIDLPVTSIPASILKQY